MCKYTVYDKTKRNCLVSWMQNFIRDIDSADMYKAVYSKEIGVINLKEGFKTSRLLKHY